LGLQTKLKVNEPGDIYEQEADRIADQVMTAPAHSSASGAPPRIQRFAGQPTGQAETAPVSVDQALASAGRPLEPVLRQDMEQRFGHDFSQVRVHSGAAAEQSAREVSANAYTVGHNIVFGAGQFAPGAHEGRRLLAHELTHVVQQADGAGMSSSSLQRQPAPDPDAELAAAEAEALAFVRTGEQQSDAEDALKLDARKRNSKAYAWLLGGKDRDRMKSSRKLSPKHRYEVAVKVRFFRGEAKAAYIQTITPTLSEFAEDVSAILDETLGADSSKGQDTQQLQCDLTQNQFVLEYEGEPWNARCMDITTDPEFLHNRFDPNIAGAVAYAVEGTTWENVEYESFNVILVKYKNGSSEFFMLSDIGQFYFGRPDLSLREFSYLKRAHTGYIYPIRDGKIYSNEILTPKLISYKNGLPYQVKELQDLFTLLQIGGTFAGIMGAYGAVSGPSGVRSAFQGFRSVKRPSTTTTPTTTQPPPTTRVETRTDKPKVSTTTITTKSVKTPAKQTGRIESEEAGSTVLSRTDDDPGGAKGGKKAPAKKIDKQQDTQSKVGGKKDDQSEDPKGGKARTADKKPEPADKTAVKTEGVAKMSDADKATRVGEIRQERTQNDAEIKELEVKIDGAKARWRDASAKAVDAKGAARDALVDKAKRNKQSEQRWKDEQEAVRLRNKKLREEEARLVPPKLAPKSWQEAEASLRTEFVGQKQTLSTATKDADLGKRDIDCYTTDKVSREAKFGRQKINDHIRAEINKDVALMKAKKVVRTEWHFYENPDSGGLGPDSTLKAALDSAEITVVIKK